MSKKDDNGVWGVQIFDDNYKTIVPKPQSKSIAIFSSENARIVFLNCGFLDFVIALNEKTGTFKKCFSLEEVIEFYKG